MEAQKSRPHAVIGALFLGFDHFTELGLLGHHVPESWGWSRGGGGSGLGLGLRNFLLFVHERLASRLGLGAELCS